MAVGRSSEVTFTDVVLTVPFCVKPFCSYARAAGRCQRYLRAHCAVATVAQHSGWHSTAQQDATATAFVLLLPCRLPPNSRHYRNCTTAIGQLLATPCRRTLALLPTP